jgi:hypothetical protein
LVPSFNRLLNALDYISVVSPWAPGIHRQQNNSGGPRVGVAAEIISKHYIREEFYLVDHAQALHFSPS